MSILLPENNSKFVNIILYDWNDVKLLITEILKLSSQPKNVYIPKKFVGSIETLIFLIPNIVNLYYLEGMLEKEKLKIGRYNYKKINITQTDKTELMNIKKNLTVMDLYNTQGVPRKRSHNKRAYIKRKLNIKENSDLITLASIILSME